MPSPLTGPELLRYVQQQQEKPGGANWNDVIEGAGYVAVRMVDGNEQRLLNRLQFHTELAKAQGIQFEGMEQQMGIRQATGRIRRGSNGIIPISAAYSRQLVGLPPRGYVKVEVDTDENCIIIYPHPDQR